MPSLGHITRPGIMALELACHTFAVLVLHREQGPAFWPSPPPTETLLMPSSPGTRRPGKLHVLLYQMLALMYFCCCP